MKSLLWITSSTFLLTSLATAAPQGSEVRRNEIVAALRLPLDGRMKILSEKGQEGLDGLVKVAFDSREKLDNRWRAVTSIGRLYPRVGRQHIERALNSKEWYMRNAASMVLKYGERAWAIKWARVLIHDQALVVRTAAVEALREMRSAEAESLLWEKLYSSENYKAGQSLWIRKHIAEALFELSQKGKEAEFVRMLSDRDDSLHPIAMRALERTTNYRYETPEQWVAWWQTRDTKTE